MQLGVRYLGRSKLGKTLGERIIQLAPNLTRDQVSFDAQLLEPLRFREAISALHDVVINDLRFQPRDKTAYEEYRKNLRQQETEIRRQAFEKAHKEYEAQGKRVISQDLKREHARSLKLYWAARRQLNSHLRTHNQVLWRKLMPYDPVITVADDVVFFECFSADESSYGCLTLDRDGCFGSAGQIGLGTTNVDYSWDLYNSFQTLRTYRQTRFNIDPSGFEVKTTDGGKYIEEKIDLPDGWLRGFMQLQSAMAMPMRRVELSVSAVYSLLAFLKRNKARMSPRAIRFELQDGKTPHLVLEPWEKPITSYSTIYRGPTDEPVRIWGRRRLLVLSRLLPLADGVDVYLLGTGLPSFWVVRMGQMRLTLGLSGWTINDWTRGTAIDLLMPQHVPVDGEIARAADALNRTRQNSLSGLATELGESTSRTASWLNQLTLRGQAIYDLHAQQYRWRQVLPIQLSDREIGSPHPELAGAQHLLTSGKFTGIDQQPGPRGGIILTGKVEGKPCEVLVDGDGRVKRGKCLCGYYKKYSLRNGPCRHMQVLRDWLWMGESRSESTDWYDRLARWAGR